MSGQPDTSIETYLDRVDERLAELTDNGEKAVFLNLCIGRAERKRERFEETLDPRYGDAFQIAEVLSGLHTRHANVMESIRASIVDAEDALSKPGMADFLAVAHARRIGFELPMQPVDKVH